MMEGIADILDIQYVAVVEEAATFDLCNKSRKVKSVCKEVGEAKSTTVIEGTELARYGI